jgi:hypothetical protein
MVKPTLQVDYRTFERECREKGTMETWNFLVEKWKACQEVVNYKWDTTAIRITNIFGQAFAMHINKSTLSLWNESGHVSLDTYTMTEFGFAEGEFKRMIETMNDWTRGLAPCSECGEKIEYHKSQGRTYFAGIYCSNCWETKYKAIEASESYN